MTPAVFERLLGLLDEWNQMDANNTQTISDVESIVATGASLLTGYWLLTAMNGIFRDGAGPPASFYAYVTLVNDKLIKTQVQNIDNTIEVIERKRFEDPDWLSTTLEHQAEMALKWCTRFGIPAHPTAKPTY
jgi:hypothetical protein